MKEKLVISIYSPLTYPNKSGAGLNAYNMAKAYVAQGHDVNIISFNYSQDPKRQNINGINIRKIRYFNDNILFKIFSYFIILPVYFNYVFKSNINIVFGPLQGYMLILIFGKILKKKVIFRSTMFGRDDVNSLILKYGDNLLKIRKRIIGLMYGYISQSSAMTSSLKHQFGNKIPFIESAQGVDTKTFFPINKLHKSKLRRELNLPVNKKIIVSVGYVIERKGYREIIKALNNIDDNNFLYIIIGNFQPSKDHYLYNLRNEMRSIYDYGNKILSNNISFIGESNHVNKYLRCADLFILNSSQEGMPNVLLESMASGIPVIISKIEGVDGFISKNNETAVVVENERQITNAVNKIFINKKFTKYIINNSINLILENYRMENVSKIILKKFL